MPDTLRSICEQCTHLNNPQLDFVSEERHREIIFRDLRELVSAASAEPECEKTVVILAGCVLEAVLYSFIQGQETYIAQRRGVFTFNPDHGLENFVSIFHRWFRDVLPAAVLPDFVIDYRDLVHINREVNSSPDICTHASREMLRILNALLGELPKFAPPAF